MPNAVDLFCGCGGFSLGLREAGFKPVLAVDIDPDAIKTYKHHFKGVVALQSDVGSTAVKDCLAKLRNIDVVVGGPPCQGFSHLNVSHKQDKRNALPLTFVRLAASVRPRLIVMEQVQTFSSMDGGKVKNQVICALQKMGYPHYKEGVANASHYGAATIRRRYVLVAARSRQDLPLAWPPKPTTSKAKTVRQAWRESKFKGSDAKLHPTAIPDFVVAKINQNKDKAKTRFFDHSYKPLLLDQPSPTLSTYSFAPASGRFSVPTPTGYRRLTISEAKLIQGFPADFYFMQPEGPLSHRTKAYQQIGNSVSPRVAAAIGRSLLR